MWFISNYINIFNTIIKCKYNIQLMAQKVNITIGRFQPFTKGHLNMVTEGELPCIIYRINSSKKDSGSIIKSKIAGKTVKKDNVKNVLSYLNGDDIKLNELEKEILKRPFTNELIEKEFDIIKRNYKKYFVDIIYVKNAYEALADFNYKVSNGEYEPNFLMCGDDRLDKYTVLLDSDKPLIYTDGKEYKNVLKDSLKLNTGKGRTEGVSGTAVREAIIKNDKATFSKIMPNGTDSMFGEFLEAFDQFKLKLQSDINESFTNLKNYLLEHGLTPMNFNMINEGGAGGHMSHPFDYTDFTGEDLLELVENLFSGKIEDVKEKLDGTNLNATMNEKGHVVFIRGKADLNNESGGMSLEDMAEKWKDLPLVKDTFLSGGRIITEIFSKFDTKYFNPDENTRKVINCECIRVGKTNVIPYPEDRVAFHGYKIYKKVNGKWEESETVEGHVKDIYDAAANINAAKPRANLIIKSVEEANKFAKDFKKRIGELFRAEKLDISASIEEWKLNRFMKVKPEWMNDEVEAIFNRWFNSDKSFKAAILKKLYPEHYSEIMSDKFGKQYVELVMEPIDELFMSIGNTFIRLCDGFTNKEKHNTVVDTIKNDLSNTIKAIEKDGSDTHKAQLERNLNRLKSLGDNYINSAEGVVFMYKGKLMKLTGSFAAINQILGILKFNR